MTQLYTHVHPFLYSFPLWFITGYWMSFLCYTVGPCCWSVLNIIAKPAFLIAIVDGVSFHLIIYFLISYLLRSRERESIWVNRVERYVESFSLLSLSWIFSFCLESVTMTFLIILYSLCVCVCVCSFLLWKVFELRFLFLNRLSSFLLLQDFSKCCRIHYTQTFFHPILHLNIRDGS